MILNSNQKIFPKFAIVLLVVRLHTEKKESSGTQENTQNAKIFHTWVKVQGCILGIIFWDLFAIWVFFHEHSRFTGQQGKREAIYLTPLYHSTCFTET